jgi:cell division protein FtsZ
MMTYPKYLDRSETPVVRLIGLGNAGVTLADRICMNHRLDIETIAINSDQQSLSSSIAPTKIAIGPLATRGLGAGGDPEIGQDAARESISDIEAAAAGADIVFLCAGLGGGTASGAALALAESAKRSGALLIAIVTSPFEFEGRRRTKQATAALQEIEAHADAVIHFENDRMAELSAPRSGVSETFACCDELLGGCVAAIVRLVSAPGPLGVGLPDLLSLLGDGDGRCLFGTAAATGDNRAHEAMEGALKSPLLDHGRMLGEAASLLVHISGPPSLSLAEVGAVMREISRKIPEPSLLHLGVSTFREVDAPVVVSIIGKCGSPKDSLAAVPPRQAKTPEAPKERSPAQGLGFEDLEPSPPRPAHPRAPQSEHKPAAPKVKQETLQFEPVARGRFEKIEPTIVEGEDLDVPTFLRLAGKKR